MQKMEVNIFEFLTTLPDLRERWVIFFFLKGGLSLVDKIFNFRAHASFSLSLFRRILILVKYNLM